jgi:hypothetical protein
MSLSDFLKDYPTYWETRFAGTTFECIAVQMDGLSAVRWKLFILDDYFVSASVSGNFVELQKR